jgi:hypothetical protein
VNTIKNAIGEEYFWPGFLAKVSKTRINNSWCQVYVGINFSKSIDDVGDWIFTSENGYFDSKKPQILLLLP